MELIHSHRFLDQATKSAATALIEFLDAWQHEQFDGMEDNGFSIQEISELGDVTFDMGNIPLSVVALMALGLALSAKHLKMSDAAALTMFTISHEILYEIGAIAPLVFQSIFNYFPKSKQELFTLMLTVPSSADLDS